MNGQNNKHTCHGFLSLNYIKLNFFIELSEGKTLN